MKDPRIQSVELKGILQDDVRIEKLGVRTANYDKSFVTRSDMKNWGLLRCINEYSPFSGDSVTGDYTYNLDGTGVDIVVIDSGVDPEHPEFAVNADGTGGSRVVDFDWSSLGVPGVASASSIGGYLGDSDGHGSNCASIAAGNTCGWASGAAIYSIRIFNGYDIRSGQYLGAIDSDLVFDLVAAFHLRKKAEGNTRPTICTNSWGYSAGYSYMEYTVWRGTQYNTTFRNADYGQVYYGHPYSLNYLNTSVDNAAAVGVIMVGAAGNSRHKIDVPGGIDYDNYYRYNFTDFYDQVVYSEDVYYHRGGSPTCAPSMITVGALDNNAIERKANFSETGPRVDIYAPGVMIMGAYANVPYQDVATPDPRNPEHYLNKISGTSQATPQVTGMLACILQARPEMTTAQAKDFLATLSVNDALVESGTGTYADTTSLQGGVNKLLKTPFTNPIRGKMGNKE